MLSQVSILQRIRKDVYRILHPFFRRRILTSGVRSRMTVRSTVLSVWLFLIQSTRRKCWRKLVISAV